AARSATARVGAAEWVALSFIGLMRRHACPFRLALLEEGPWPLAGIGRGEDLVAEFELAGEGLGRAGLEPLEHAELGRRDPAGRVGGDPLGQLEGAFEQALAF